MSLRGLLTLGVSGKDSAEMIVRMKMHSYCIEKIRFVVKTYVSCGNLPISYT